MVTTGAGTALLLGEVAKKVRELGIVVWLDAESHYVGFTDYLREKPDPFTYDVVRFDGSYLELLIALKNYGSDTYPEKVLIHLPGLNKDSVKETPAFELYKAGKVFEKSLATVVREAAVGVARPEDVETFVRSPSLSLVGADAWLEEQRDQHTGDLGLVLGALGTDGVVLGLVAGDRRITEKLEEHGEKIFAFLQKALGVTSAWRQFQIDERALNATSMAVLVASWLMTVEFVHDLKEEPATAELRALTKLGPVAKECQRLSARLRDQYPDIYEQLANELQERFEVERTSHHARALGAIDTFRFEEATVRAAVIGAIRDGNWALASELAADRTTESCFWVRRSPTRQRTWEVLRYAARVGVEIERGQRGLEGATSLDEAADRYAGKLAAVDQHHRLFEQRFHAQIGSDLEDYDALLDVRAAVRSAYRVWADDLTRAFHELCVERGPLPSASARQRSIYLEEVHSRLENGGRVAYVMVDALRFEMARALADELLREKYSVSLKPRLAELPTVTAVGMNALAPVEQAGRLRPVMTDGDIEGFYAGEFRVVKPGDRVKSMEKRSLSSVSAADIPLEKFHSLSVSALRQRIAGKSLIVVRSLDLDTAGESELHLSTFERTLTQLKSAISMLAQAGIQQFVVTSDHGFLLQDATVENIPFGVSMRVPQRRHAASSSRSGMPGVLEVSLSELGYDTESDGYLVFRPDTAVWKTNTQVSSFVHGGNSLQERVIPVLVVEREGARGKTMARYEVVARAQPAHLGRQRLSVSVRLQSESNAPLGFIAPKTISLALRIEGAPHVAITLLDAQPPASLRDGRILIPPNKDEALVEFELEGPADDKVRVEIFHPDAAEEVAPKVVDGFFDVARDRRLGKAKGAADSTVPPPNTTPASLPLPAPSASTAAGASWRDAIEDLDYRKAFVIIEKQRVISEVDLAHELGSPRAVRAFSRGYEQFARLLPFEIEVVSVNGMKAWRRKD